MALVDFIPVDGQKRIAQAITEAEKRTSGEICVHITPHCRFSPIWKAKRKFNKLHLYKTLRRNAVLIFIAYKSQKFAIIGDTGINDAVPKGFWDQEKETLAASLANGRQVDGLCEIIARIGESLSTYFPADREDLNEISNEITYED